HELDALNIMGASFSPDGRTLVTGHSHCTKTGKGRDQRREFTREGRVWGVAPGRGKEGPPRAPYQVVLGKHISPARKYVWVSDEHRARAGQTSESYLHVWDVAAKTVRLRLAGFSRAVFAPDGTRLAASTDKGRIKVFESRTGKELAELPLKTGKGWVLERV